MSTRSRWQPADADARVAAVQAAVWQRILPAGGPPAETYVRRPRATRTP